MSLAVETEYIQDQLQTIKDYQDNLNSNPTNQVLVNSFINQTQLVKDAFLQKFDKDTWMAPVARKIQNHVNRVTNSSSNATANSTNSSNSTNSTSTPASNSTVSANASNATAPVSPSVALAAPNQASIISRKGNKVTITRVLNQSNSTANVQKNPDQDQKIDRAQPIESSQDHGEKSLPKMPITMPKDIPSPPSPPKSMTKFVDKIRGN